MTDPFSPSDWPNDVTGDVFRRMHSDGFDFSKPHEIDFNVDFDSWPPPQEALLKISERFNRVRVFEPGDGDTGYVQITIHDFICYDMVTDILDELTGIARPFGGWSDSWGVMQEPDG